VHNGLLTTSTVTGDGEPVGFIPDLLHQVRGGGLGARLQAVRGNLQHPFLVARAS
jgi:hypothetical protein